MTGLDQGALALSEFDVDGASGEYEQELMKAARAAVEALRELTSDLALVDRDPVDTTRTWEMVIDAILRGCRD
jgi:hypothetical protein